MKFHYSFDLIIWSIFTAASSLQIKQTSSLSFQVIFTNHHLSTCLEWHYITWHCLQWEALYDQCCTILSSHAWKIQSAWILKHRWETLHENYTNEDQSWYHFKLYWIQLIFVNFQEWSWAQVVEGRLCNYSQGKKTDCWIVGCSVHPI